MTKTAKDVITRALKNMTVIGADGEATGTDYQDAYDVYEGLYSDLKQDFARTLLWDLDNVPDNIWTHVSALLARELLGTFKISDNNRTQVLEAAALSEIRFAKRLARRSRVTVKLPLV